MDNKQFEKKETERSFYKVFSRVLGHKKGHPFGVSLKTNKPNQKVVASIASLKSPIEATKVLRVGWPELFRVHLN